MRTRIVLPVALLLLVAAALSGCLWRDDGYRGGGSDRREGGDRSDHRDGSDRRDGSDVRWEGGGVHWDGGSGGVNWEGGAVHWDNDGVREEGERR
jgi:hypothetical protein